MTPKYGHALIPRFFESDKRDLAGVFKNFEMGGIILGYLVGLV